MSLAYGGAAVTATLPFSAPRRGEAKPDPAPRFFEAIIPAPKGTRFDNRLARVFEGVPPYATMAFVLVNRAGDPVDEPKSVSDLSVAVRSQLYPDDRVFAWIRGVDVRRGGERLAVLFQPQGRADGDVSRLFRDLMSDVGVVEVADVTERVEEPAR